MYAQHLIVTARNLHSSVIMHSTCHCTKLAFISDNAQHRELVVFHGIRSNYTCAFESLLVTL